jgi:hypothetical protein
MKDAGLCSVATSAIASRRSRWEMCEGMLGLIGDQDLPRGRALQIRKTELDGNKVLKVRQLSRHEYNEMGLMMFYPSLSGSLGIMPM